MNLRKQWWWSCTSERKWKEFECIGALTNEWGQYLVKDERRKNEQANIWTIDKTSKKQTNEWVNE